MLLSLKYLKSRKHLRFIAHVARLKHPSCDSSKMRKVPCTGVRRSHSTRFIMTLYSCGEIESAASLHDEHASAYKREEGKV